jgi:hypothetical protein
MWTDCCRWVIAAFASCAGLMGLEVTADAAMPRLKVSHNQHFLVTEDGKPFFWLGDTAWELFHRLNREEAGRYLEDRARKGFTVIQSVALAELDDKTREDYHRAAFKPVLDGEPIYEDHPVSFKAKELGHSIASDVRRPLYWDLFSGACGHTYRHHSVWQMWAPGRKPINDPLLPWFEAIDQPGAGKMQFSRRLIESRPFLARIPDDSIIASDPVSTSVPGAGRNRFTATRDDAGSYAMVYAPVGRRFKVRLDTINGAKVKAWWFNPRNGEATAIGTFENKGGREFRPPDKGEMLDWVLVLDDASKKYPVPGVVKR